MTFGTMKTATHQIPFASTAWEMRQICLLICAWNNPDRIGLSKYLKQWKLYEVYHFKINHN